MTINHLENDFEREAEDERTLKADNVPPSKVRGAPEPFFSGPTPSTARTTSVLNRMG